MAYQKGKHEATLLMRILNLHTKGLLVVYTSERATRRFIIEQESWLASAVACEFCFNKCEEEVLHACEVVQIFETLSLTSVLLPAADCILILLLRKWKFMAVTSNAIPNEKGLSECHNGFGSYLPSA